MKRITRSPNSPARHVPTGLAVVVAWLSNGPKGKPGPWYWTSFPSPVEGLTETNLDGHHLATVHGDDLVDADGETTPTKPLNSYERKQEERRKRLERAADRASGEATSAFNRAHSLTDGIPFGQPILVGHHSEKRHRRTLDKADRAMRRGCEALDESRELASRASAVGTGGISSDDPDAIEKLVDKRSELEVRRDYMKAANKFYKTHKTLAGWDGPEALKEKALSYIRHNGVPFPSYALQNLGARIRDAAKRTKVIEATAAIAAENPEGKRTEHPRGGVVIEDPAENRVLVQFPKRLSRDDYKRVRSAGFVWTPSRNAFTRKYSTTAIYWGNQLATVLPSDVPEPAATPAEGSVCGCGRVTQPGQPCAFCTSTTTRYIVDAATLRHLDAWLGSHERPEDHDDRRRLIVTWLEAMDQESAEYHLDKGWLHVLDRAGDEAANQKYVGQLLDGAADDAEVADILRHHQG